MPSRHLASGRLPVPAPSEDHPTVSKESWDKYFEGIILDECLDEGLDKGLLEVVPSDLPPSGGELGMGNHQNM